jgi:hypothetical protein
MGRACRMHWEKRNAYNVLVGKLEGIRSLGLRTRLKIILKCILEENCEMVRDGLVCFRIGTFGGIL